MSMQRPEVGARCPGAAVMGSREVSNMDAGNGTRGFSERPASALNH